MTDRLSRRRSDIHAEVARDYRRDYKMIFPAETQNG
jgi:hypothetical protein